MRNEILSNIDNPAELEQLYRSNKSGFKRAFNTLSADLANSPLAAFWNARLNVTRDEISWGNAKDLGFVLIACIWAAIIAKLPAILSLNEEHFFMRNTGFIVFPFLTAYFAWKNQLSASKIAGMAIITLGCVIYINLLPGNEKNDTLVLACIHLPLLLWAVLGYAFAGNSVEKRLGYLIYNGDLLVMSALMVIAGGILTAITINLFDLIGFHIEKFYFNYVVVIGAACAPIVGTWLTRSNPQLVGKVSPVIARIFTPLVLVMLVIYLVAIIYSGKDPYNNREFLAIFNALLIGVLALIFFSVAETSKVVKNKTEVLVLFLLSIVTIIVNGIALSAILFRISEWGITANRTAVLGGNVLILVNLLLVAAQLYRVMARKANMSGVKNVIADYLPVYCLWAGVVTFLFPFLFGFK